LRRCASSTATIARISRHGSPTTISSTSSRAIGRSAFAHYNDLKADLGGEMRRVAEFLGIDIPQSKWPAAIERCTFEAMRNVEDPGMFNFFEGGLKGFIFKGTNGRWRDVLGEEELAMYQTRLVDALSPEAVKFVEGGRHAIGLR
jgi:aryl sulfotransferase